MLQVNHWTQVSGSVFTGEGWAEQGRIWKAEIPAWRPKSRAYGANARLQHFVKAKFARIARQKTGNALLVADWPRTLPPGRFTLTIQVEQPSGKLMDDDNLAGCAKNIRDACADWLGTHDGPGGPIRWRYRSCRGPMDRVVMTLEEVSE